MRYARETVVLGGQTPLPTDVYDVQIIEVAVKTGQKENAKPTLRVTCEIISPPSVTIGGNTYAAAGRRVYMMPNLIDADVSYGLGQIIQGLDKSKFDYTKFNPEGEIDTDRFNVLLTHKMAMKFGTKEEFQTRPCKEGESAEVMELKVPSVYIRDTKGELMSKGHFIVNSKGQSPGWQDVLGPSSDTSVY